MKHNIIILPLNNTVSCRWSSAKIFAKMAPKFDPNEVKVTHQLVLDFCGFFSMVNSGLLVPWFMNS